MILKTKEEAFDREEIKAAISEWLKENPNLPKMVRAALESYGTLLDTLDKNSSSMRKLLKELRQAFGIVPKSEKRGNYGHSRRSKRQSLLEQRASIEAALAKAKKLSRSRRKRLKDINLKLKELDEIELSQAEEAEFEEDRRALREALALGEGRTDPDCLAPSESLLTGLVAGHNIEHEKASLSIDQKPEGARVFSETRSRLDIQIEISTLQIEVEKAEITATNGEKTIVSASTKEFGPKGMMVTWNFLSQMSILVGQYGMPMNRLSVMLSTEEDEITSDRIVSYFHYVAKRLTPIYLFNAKTLGNSLILAGDDTTTRTLEVNRSLKKKVSTWEEFESPEKCQEALDSHDKPKSFLCCKIGADLPFVSFQKGKNKRLKPKTQFNTTIVHGRAIQEEPESMIVMFRSHFGSFADLIVQLLEFRSPSNDTLTIVSDLSSTNNVAKEGVEITQAGCSSHARRRFAKYDGKENDAHEIVMNGFTQLYLYEQLLDIEGRNRENSLAVRQKSAYPNWLEIKEMCEDLSKTYSSSTLLGEASRYVLKNFEALICYLNDPRLPNTNDLSERLLRPEKQIQAAACFRNSIEGRAALDVVRSIIQTCSAARVNAARYFDWLLRMDEDEISENPGRFTPYFFAKNVDQD